MTNNLAICTRGNTTKITASKTPEDVPIDVADTPPLPLTWPLLSTQACVLNFSSLESRVSSRPSLRERRTYKDHTELHVCSYPRSVDGCVENGMLDFMGDTQTPHELASPGRRVLARLIDIGIVVSAGAAIVLMITPGAFARSVIYVLIGAIYETAMIAMRGQTVGKMITNIAVVHVDTAITPSPASAAIRWMTHGIWTLVPFGLVLTLTTFASPGFRDRMRGFHDTFAQTVVVEAA